MIYDSGGIFLIQFILVTQYNVYLLWCVICDWVFLKKLNIRGLGSFCITYLFFKPNMYIFYLLFMIMIPLKTYHRLQHNMYIFVFHVWYVFNAVTHFFYQDSSIYDFNHILFLYNVRNFYFTTYISFKVRYRLFVTQ